MAETAAHLVDHVFPQVPVRDWVLSLPKRLRYFPHHDTRLVSPVLRIFLAEVEAALRSCSPAEPDGARFGAITFAHRFGSAFNANLHFHCCVIDGVFSAEREGVRFHPAFLTDRAIARVQQPTRQRVLKLFQRRGLLPTEAVAMMRRWEQPSGDPFPRPVRVSALFVIVLARRQDPAAGRSSLPNGRQRPLKFLSFIRRCVPVA